jgi:hypothetical protein
VRYYVREKASRERGPFAWRELRTLLRSGAVADTALVREEDGHAWYPIEDLASRYQEHDDARSRDAITDAVAPARRSARVHFLSGGIAVALGLLAATGTVELCILTVAREAFGLALAAVGGILIAVGLTVVGVVQIARGFAARP